MESAKQAAIFNAHRNGNINTKFMVLKMDILRPLVEFDLFEKADVACINFPVETRKKVDATAAFLANTSAVTKLGGYVMCLIPKSGRPTDEPGPRRNQVVSPHVTAVKHLAKYLNLELVYNSEDDSNLPDETLLGLYSYRDAQLFIDRKSSHRCPGEGAIPMELIIFRKTRPLTAE